jgi:hypothetical protein
MYNYGFGILSRLAPLVSVVLLLFVLPLLLMDVLSVPLPVVGCGVSHAAMVNTTTVRNKKMLFIN